MIVEILEEEVDDEVVEILEQTEPTLEVDEAQSEIIEVEHLSTDVHVVEIESVDLEVVEVLVEGPAGADGPPGADGADGPPGPPGASIYAGYTHIQATPAASWLVQHDLRRFVTPVLLLDEEPNEPVYTQIEFIDENNLVVIWPTPVSGRAHF